MTDHRVEVRLEGDKAIVSMIVEEKVLWVSFNSAQLEPLIEALVIVRDMLKKEPPQ